MMTFRTGQLSFNMADDKVSAFVGRLFAQGGWLGNCHDRWCNIEFADIQQEEAFVTKELENHK